MVQRWSWVPLALVTLCGAAAGCGDDDAKRAQPADGGAAPRAGAGGEAGSSGAAGLAGDATQAGGGNAGSGVNGGAPSGTGGADASPGGADASAAGAGGSASAVVRACRYPNGGACDEISGTLQDALTFQQECSGNERISLESCPSTDVAGTCTYQQAGATFRLVYYGESSDADELEAAEQSCVERSGVWQA